MSDDSPAQTDDLLKEALVADTDAETELAVSGPPAQLLTDDEIGGAEFRLIRRGVERVSGDGWNGVAVALDAVFHPAPDTHFADAEVVISLVGPQGAVFADVEPSEIKDDQPVKYSISRNGSISFKRFDVDAKLGRDDKVEYSVYHCIIRGTGEPTAKARWTFEQNKATQQGLGLSNRLVMTMAGSGPFLAEALIQARLVRAGPLEKFREMCFGPRRETGRKRSFRIEAPPQEKQERPWFSLFD